MQMAALKPASSSGSTSSSSGSSAGSSSTPLNACDLNADGAVNQADVQAAINMSLGLAPCTANIAGADVCNVEVVQRVINASLGNGCLTSTGLHVVVLTWTPSTSSGVTGYQIARSTSSTGTFTAIGTVAATATSYTDTTVVSGTTYYYEIAAVAGSTVGSYSTPAVSAPVPTP